MNADYPHDNHVQGQDVTVAHVPRVLFPPLLVARQKEEDADDEEGC